MRSTDVLVCTLCLFSVGLAKPAAPILAYQDSLGQYSFGYSAPGSARSEIRTLNGETRGAYSYIDDAGIIQTAQYIADGKNGFRVAATNLPQMPEIQSIIAARSNEAGARETEQKDSKMEEIKVLREPLRPLMQKPLEMNEMNDKMRMEIEAGENIPQDAMEAVKMSGKEILGAQLRNASQESQTGSNENPEAFKVSANQIHQILKGSSVPIFRISQGNHLLDPSIIQIPLNNQGSSDTPAGTTLKVSQESAKEPEKGNLKELPAAMEEEVKPQQQDKPMDSFKEIITPLNVLPLNSVYPTIIRYEPIQYYAY